MKTLSLLIFSSLGVMWAQTAPPPAPTAAPTCVIPDLPAEKVIARFEDGVNFTVSDLRQICAVLPAQLKLAISQDPAEFLHEYAMWRKYTQIAEKDKLDQQSPYKEALAFQRLLILSQAILDRAFREASVEQSDVVNYYDRHKADYQQVHVKAIYIPFSDTPSANELTEDQAKEKAAKLTAASRGGADFVKLVKENSKDETSRAKDGDFATLHANDNIPDAIKIVVFALKQGETSDPVRQARGYYIFRAEEVFYAPLSQVRDQIFNQLKSEAGQQWVKKTDSDTKVEFPDPTFPPKKPAGAGK